MQPFVVGREYRRSQLLDFVGSRQWQSGVLWGASEPGCLICTTGGRHGKKVGYSDEPLTDGSWCYFGQGRNGDQSLTNAANEKLASDRYTVLLFSTREPTSREIADNGYGKLFTFVGVFNVAGYEEFAPISGPRKGNRLIKFRLAPAGMGGQPKTPDEGDETPPAELDLVLLQKELATDATSEALTRVSLAEYRRRSEKVQRYARLRAGGKCEACDVPAPFVSLAGEPYLEVHHLLRLADDGPDRPENVAAVCPNCHRHAHHAMDRHEFGRKLRDRIQVTEMQVAQGLALK